MLDSYQRCYELIVADVLQGPEGQPGPDGASGLPGMKGEKVRAGGVPTHGGHQAHTVSDLWACPCLLGEGPFLIPS